MRQIFTLSLLFWVFCSAVGASEPPPAKASVTFSATDLARATDKLKQGISLEKLGKIAGAIAYYREVVEGFPGTPQAEEAAARIKALQAAAPTAAAKPKGVAAKPPRASAAKASKAPDPEVVMMQRRVARSQQRRSASRAAVRSGDAEFNSLLIQALTPPRPAPSPMGDRTQWVNGYYRADGTYVQGYYRSPASR